RLLRHDAPERGVERRLAEDDVRQHPAGRDDADAGVVAGGVDAEDEAHAGDANTGSLRSRSPVSAPGRAPRARPRPPAPPGTPPAPRRRRSPPRSARRPRGRRRRRRPPTGRAGAPPGPALAGPGGAG